MQSTQSDWNICGTGLTDTDASAGACRQSQKDTFCMSMRALACLLPPSL